MPTEELVRERSQQQGPLARAFGALLQLLQLAAVLSALLLLPAALHDGGLDLPRVWALFQAYFAFFALGSVYRILRFGRLAPRSKDAQRSSSWASRLAFVAFVVVLPLLHVAGMYFYVGLVLDGVLPATAPGQATLSELLGSICVAAAVALNFLASRALGPAYDRIVAPQKLVTTGPYRYVQHPLYSSYMLLFLGYGLLLRSPPLGVVLVAVCLLYYGLRTRLEAGVLREAFGAEYDAYAQRTRRFVPGLW